VGHRCFYLNEVSMSIKFDGQVVIVTGSGGGLGRCHALGFAARGAKVVIADFGGARDGSGGSLVAADDVVAEIKAAGGEAMASAVNVTDMAQVEAMVSQVMSAWGRVDVLVNNAGILRDKSFAKLTMEDWKAVLDVHLMGSVHCSRAVWDIMKAQNYGRIIMTTSSTGAYGNFGQTNYGAAKLALVGFQKSLYLEGMKNNIYVNSILPVAATRMTQDVMPAEMLDMLKPEFVTPAVLFLSSAQAPNNTIISAGAGVYAVAQMVESEGMYFAPADQSPENILAHWDKISNPAGQRSLNAGSEHGQKILGLVMRDK
jgi:NAD(P)-dependent dehydrogenase (short-subunit alcohol dehydrogenase family)